MIKQDYATFETAKLLKAASFAEKTKNGYTDDGIFMSYSADYPAPHLWHAMKWLRDEKKISVDVTTISTATHGVDVSTISDEIGDDDFIVIKGDIPFVTTYEAACDAGVAAACEWLIARGANDESKN